MESIPSQGPRKEVNWIFEVLTFFFKDGFLNADAAPAGKKEIPCLVIVVLLIAVQGHTLILLPPCGYTGCRTSSRYSHAGTIRILLRAGCDTTKWVKEAVR